MIDTGGIAMSNYIVFPDLYKGSALLDIINEIKKDINTYKINAQYITFSGRLKEIRSGDLDNPDTFFKHNIKVLKYLTKTLKNNDKVLFIDFFQPGLSLLKYYLDGYSKNIKFGSLLHGSSLIEEDFFEGRTWMRNLELSLLDIMHVIYVPSNYLAFSFNQINTTNKIKVLPFGFSPEDFVCNLNNEKKYDVIIPHRWSWDNNPAFIIEIIESMPQIKFAISGYGKFSKDTKLREMFTVITKKDNVFNLGIKSGLSHYKDLETAKIVLALRDTFGYSIRKAIASGCIPLALNAFAYPEFLNKHNLFNNVAEACLKIEEFVKTYPKYYKNIPKTGFKEILVDFFEHD